jgi:hypothetical protein
MPRPCNGDQWDHHPAARCRKPQGLSTWVRHLGLLFLVPKLKYFLTSLAFYCFSISSPKLLDELVETFFFSKIPEYYFFAEAQENR